MPLSIRLSSKKGGLRVSRERIVCKEETQRAEDHVWYMMSSSTHEERIGEMLQEPTKPSSITPGIQHMDKVPLLISPSKIESVTLLRTLKPRSGIVESIVLSTDGWTLVSGGGNGTIK